VFTAKKASKRLILLYCVFKKYNTLKTGQTPYNVARHTNGYVCQEFFFQGATTWVFVMQKCQLLVNGASQRALWYSEMFGKRDK